MKKVTMNSCGFDVPVMVYESVEEGDKAAGKVGAILEQANNNLAYRGALVTARAMLAIAVANVTGVKRAMVPVMEEYEEGGETKKRQAKDAKGALLEEPRDTDKKYISLALAEVEKEPEALQEAINAELKKLLVEEVEENGKKVKKPLEGFYVDIKATERAAPKPKTLPAKLLEAAKKAIEVGKVDALAKDYKKKLSKDSPDGKPLKDDKGQWIAENVGWALKEIIAENERLQTAAYGA